MSNDLTQLWKLIIPHLQELQTFRENTEVFKKLQDEIYESECQQFESDEETMVYQKLNSLSKPLYSKNVKEDPLVTIQLIELVIRNTPVFLNNDTILINENDMTIATVFGTDSLVKPGLAKYMSKIFEEYKKDGDMLSFLESKVSRTRNIGIWCKNPKGSYTPTECQNIIEVHTILERYSKKHICLIAPVTVKDILRCIVQLGISNIDFEIDCARVTDTSLAIEVFN
jgi:hypothetical protein